MKDKIEKIIFDSLIEINNDRDNKFETNKDLILMGSNGILDSMDLVNLTVLVEEKLSDELDVVITIASEAAFSRRKSPFYNIDSLSNFIIELVETNR